MKIILHIESAQVEFKTDKHGDLHIHGAGLQVDLSPVDKPKRKRRTKQQMAADALRITEPATTEIKVKAHPLTKQDAEQVKGIVMNDKGWE